MNDPKAQATAVARPPTKWRSRLFALGAAVYLVGAFASTVVMQAYADHGPLTLLMAYGPRWPALAPLVVLLPWAALERRWRWAAALSASAPLLLFGFMGFNLPTGGGTVSEDAPAIRAVTYNIQARDLDAPWLTEVLKSLDPDVLAMVECRPPEGYVAPEGYHFGTSYTLCLLSKLPIVHMDARDQTDAFARYGHAGITLFELEGPRGPLFVEVVHLATSRAGIEAVLHERWNGVDAVRENFELRSWESEQARKWLEKASGPFLVMGDLNLPVESAIYRTHWGDLDNAFSSCGVGFGNTKHTRKFGSRIDHVLTSSTVTCEDAYVAPIEGSDHRPLVVDARLGD